MFRKLFVFYAIAAFGTAIVFAQAPPSRAGIIAEFPLGEGGYLGVETVEITKDNFAKYGLREVRGVAIDKVLDGSPAAAAGLQAGDVIIAINGDSITSSRKLTRLMSEVSPDHAVKLTVLRGGSEREITATAGKRPMPVFTDGNFRFNFPSDFPNVQMPEMGPMVRSLPRGQAMPRIPNFPSEDFVWAFGPTRQIGISITPLTKQLSEHFGVESGVMIDSVRDNSPASKAGLKAGDIIVEVEGKAIRVDGDLIRAMSEKKEGDISLTIVRDGNRQTVKVTPEEMKVGFDGAVPAPRPPAKPGTPSPMPAMEPFFFGRVI